MDKREKILFASEYKRPLRIRTVKEREYTILPDRITEEKVLYHFTNGTEGQIRFVNLMSLDFQSSADEEFYKEWLVQKRFSIENLGQRVKNLSEYYLEILQKLRAREGMDPELAPFWEFKIKTYEEMFQRLFWNEKNLLLQYMTGSRERLDEGALAGDPLLLLCQSNQSQKRCVKAAMKNRVSIIEGPPGTGKTTTILSIIANLVRRDQKVLVVSKNNAAIDNIAEELEEMELPQFFIRMGNDRVMRSAGTGLREKLETYQKALEGLRENAGDEERGESEPEMERLEQELSAFYEMLQEKENHLNELVRLDNELGELKNQLRHLEKRRDAYGNIEEPKTIPRHAEGIYKRLELFNEMSEMLEKEGHIGVLKQIRLFLAGGDTLGHFRKEGIGRILFYEERYLRLRIRDLEQKIIGEDMDGLKKEIEGIYKKHYVPLSEKMLRRSLSKRIDEKSFQTLYDAIERAEGTQELEDIMKAQKERLISLYPVILTTVDSVQSNFYRNLQRAEPVDAIIIDEASQCDIVSALPLLFLAKRIVVVGDSRQLEAIKGIEKGELLREAEAAWDYTEHSFLTSMEDVFAPPVNLLMEHYRCDFSIINYCNKFFYDDQLIIYRGASKDAMVLVDDDKGKYVDQDGGSFFNEREIITVDGLTGGETSGRFFITPFKGHADRLIQRYGKQRCGTIHTFQGKGENEVYFMTVLNHTDAAKQHLAGSHNLFGKELINVAVSRAKTRFVMVTDVRFFKKYDVNVANLIRYIEAYGMEIPDKTVCLFDYLYRKMPCYQPKGKSDNPFEEQLEEFLNRFVKEKKNLRFVMKLPLADLITDRTYLWERPDIRDFILNHAHLDYTLYDIRLNLPVLVIELDGQEHRKPEQAVRDRKKEEALEHMGIPLLRVRSKEAWEEQKLREKLEEYLEEGVCRIANS